MDPMPIFRCLYISTCLLAHSSLLQFDVVVSICVIWLCVCARVCMSTLHINFTCVVASFVLIHAMQTHITTCVYVSIYISSRMIHSLSISNYIIIVQIADECKFCADFFVVPKWSLTTHPSSIRVAWQIMLALTFLCRLFTHHHRWRRQQSCATCYACPVYYVGRFDSELNDSILSEIQSQPNAEKERCMRVCLCRYSTSEARVHT